MLAASTDLEDVPIRLLLENPLEVEVIEDWIRELLFETCGTRDGVTVELVKIEDGVTVELMKIETEVVFTEEYTGLIEVMELNIVVVLLTLSTDLEEVAVTLLFENSPEGEIIVD